MGQGEDRGSDGVHHQCPLADCHPPGFVFLGSARDRLDVLRCHEWLRYSIQRLLLQRIDEQGVCPSSGTLFLNLDTLDSNQ